MRHLKQKFITALAVLCLSLYAAGFAHAAIFGDEEGQPITPQAGIDTLYQELEGSGIAQEQNLTELVFKYINFVLPYLALVAFAGFVYAGFLYVTHFGVEEQLTKAKRILIWSIVGLILVVISYTVVNLFTKELVESINQ